MKRPGRIHLTLPLMLATAALLGCNDQPNLLSPEGAGPDLVTSEKGGKPGGETAGNNLSFPVIWAEGVQKTLPGSAGMTPLLSGEWWYQWGTNGSDPNITPASCLPDPDEGDIVLNPLGDPFCDDGALGSLTLPAGQPAATNPLSLAKAYVQKDPLNLWQAWAGDAGASGEAESDGRLVVDWIDWGDNLESVDWYTRSQVRTEVVLFQDLTAPKLEYQMRHTSGWGIDEAHGLEATLSEIPAAVTGPGTQATVYTHCARLTIQKLLVDRNDSRLGDLEWIESDGWTEPAEDPLNPGSPYPALLEPHGRDLPRRHADDPAARRRAVLEPGALPRPDRGDVRSRRAHLHRGRARRRALRPGEQDPR